MPTFKGNITEINWLIQGETGSGNTLADTSPSYPNGNLNRPLVELWENTVNLDDRVTVLEGISGGSISTDFVQSGTSTISTTSTPETYIVFGSNLSQINQPLASAISSVSANVNSTISSAIASETANITPTATTSKYNALLGTDSCSITVTGTECWANVVAASSDTVLGGNDVTQTFVAGADNCIVNASNHAVLLASQRVQLDGLDHVVAGGYASSGSALSSNRKWQLNSKTGDILASGVITGSSSFSDFAEYFESGSGEAIPTGFIVALDGENIRKANSADTDLLGVISETPAMVLGSQEFVWQGRTLRNEFGGLTNEENPDYDGSIPYKPRKERPEWNIVGLLGQIYVRCDETVKPGDYIWANDYGIATAAASGSWRVMKMTTPYDEAKGYGVALVFVR